MSTEKVLTESVLSPIRDDFLKILNFYRDKVGSPWFYGVKLPKNNPHSLASVLGVSSPGDVLEILYEFGLATRYRDGFRLEKKTEAWTDGELKIFFPTPDYVNECKAKCSGSLNIRHFFVNIGGKVDKLINLTQPQEQGLVNDPQQSCCRWKIKGNGDLCNTHSAPACTIIKTNNNQLLQGK